ncbi:MAG TPA: hypothetical protein VMS73_03580, partial [Anaerolineaceae bacterium]|nr:hypothetical protein [Anaerolineaceae bacterium]
QNKWAGHLSVHLHPPVFGGRRHRSGWFFPYRLGSVHPDQPTNQLVETRFIWKSENANGKIMAGILHRRVPFSLYWHCHLADIHATRYELFRAHFCLSTLLVLSMYQPGLSIIDDRLRFCHGY